MQTRITWRLDRSPSVLANLFRAFATFGKRRSHAPPVHEATLTGVTPDPEKHAAFLSICDSPPCGGLHTLYPFAMCYPLAMRVLASHAMPFSMTQVLNSRNVVVQARQISTDETVDLRCSSTLWRSARRGCELDLILDVASRGELVWSCTATYLVRGASAATADPEAPQTRLSRLETTDTVATWRLGSGDRIRFAEVSGDVNGLHFWPWYARRLGFERDFAQPLRVVTRCVDLLPSIATAAWPRRLEFHLKGPVYYGSTLTLRGAAIGDQYRFDLHLEEDSRPCIVGQMGHLRPDHVTAPIAEAEATRAGTCATPLPRDSASRSQ